jgi:hypothetical protein
MAFAAGGGEQSLRALGVLGPNFPHGLQVVQSSGAATGSGEQSLGTTGVPGPDFPQRLQGAHFCGAAGLCLITCGAMGAMGPAYTRLPISLAFQDESNRLYIEGSMDL